MPITSILDLNPLDLQCWSFNCEKNANKNDEKSPRLAPENTLSFSYKIERP